jgi:hypothetical protein
MAVLGAEVKGAVQFGSREFQKVVAASFAVSWQPALTAIWALAAPT